MILGVVVSSIIGNFTYESNQVYAKVELVLHVNFDENVNDYSGRGNDGTIVGNPKFVDGIHGKQSI